MAKKLEGPVIGIDLGTSYSCVGVWLNNHVEIVVNGQGNRTTPSCVAFTDTERLVGEAAENQSITNPTNTIIGAKRLIGRRFEDPDVQGRICLYPFEVTEGPKGEPTFAVNHKGERKEFNPEEISSMILKGMRKISENYTGRTVKNAVVTVPAYFNNSQRRATRTAGQMAGLNILRIINEPTAAAVGYGLHNFVDMVERNVLVFDLGGGTFDVSIVNIKGGQMKVKATTGDTCLGGEDFTDRMVSYFMKTFRKAHGKDLSGNPKALRRLRTQCEKAKKALSFSTETTIDLDYLHEDIDFQAKITRSMFEDLNMDLFLSCIDIVRKCLSDVGMKKRDIHDVVLVGGSTRIPKVEELLKEFFRGTKMSKSISPDEIVAHGATMLAAKLAGEGGKDVKDLVLHDVTPLSLGIEKIGRTMRVLIPKNTPIPTRVEYHFTTVLDNQKCIAIRVYEGERTMVEQNNFLGRFELDGITPAPAKTKKITISFDVDADGVLTVSAEDRGSGVRKEMTITDQNSRLGSIEIERIVDAAAGQKEKDEQEKEKAEAKGKLKNQIYNLEAKLRTNNSTGSKMNQASNKKMEEEIARVNAWLESNQEAEALDFDQMRNELESFCKEISKRKSWWSKVKLF